MYCYLFFSSQDGFTILYGFSYRISGEIYKDLLEAKNVCHFVNECSWIVDHDCDGKNPAGLRYQLNYRNDALIENKFACVYEKSEIKGMNS